MAKVRYRVIRDTREKKGWFFPTDDNCLGYIDQKLDTGDYSIEDYEDVVSVERKASIDELAGNLKDPRFFRELVRLEKFPYPFLILEFTIQDLFDYPNSSKMSKAQKEKLRINSGFLFKKLMEIYWLHPRISVIFAGNKYTAFHTVQRIFRYVVDHHVSD